MNRTEYIKENHLLNSRFERKYKTKVYKSLQAIVNRVAGEIEANGVRAGMNEAALIVSTGSLNSVISSLYLEVGLRYARRQWRRFLAIKKAFGFNQVWIDFILNFLTKHLLQKITFKVAESTREAILAIIEKGVEEGWGVDKIVAEMKEMPFTKYQAERITRTEVMRASNTGTMAAASTFEYEQQKEWIAANDARTRGTNPEDHASHRGLDGEVVDYEGVFTDPRNGDKLRFPGDPGGNGIPETKPESTINCRCTVSVTAKFDERGRLIPKRKINETV